MGNIFINEKGNIYGRLRVLRRGESKNTTATWVCLCDPELGGCGNETTVVGSSLRRGSTNSCGCLRKEIISELKKLPMGQASFNILHSDYKRRAEGRDLLFELTKEDFSFLTKMNCHYCGAEPSKHTGGDYIYNGIDRVDNSKGYALDNIVPCCWVCNYMKKALNIQEFLGHIEKIYDRRVKNARNSP